MTPDLDDAIRSSLRRHAEAAPSEVHLDRVRGRAEAIGRRRRRQAYAAVATAAAAALVVGIGLSSLRGTTSSLPVGPDPSPSASAPRLPAPPASLPWTAGVDPLDDTPSSAVWVRHPDGRGDVVADIAGPTAQVVAWVGAGRRTLVVASSGSDFLNLRTITLGADGSPVGGFPQLTLAGIGPSGLAFPLADGGFAWAWPSVSSQDWAVAFVDADLRVTRRPGLIAGTPLMVSRENVVSTIGAGVLRVYAGASSGDLSLCPDGVAGITMPDQGFAALTCVGDGSVHVVSLTPTAQGVAGTVTDLPSPGAEQVRQLWFAPDGSLYAALSSGLRPDGSWPRVTTRLWNADGWSDAAQQNVLRRVYGVGATTASLVVGPDGSLGWVTDTAPGVPLGPGSVDPSFATTLVVGSED